MRRHPIQLTGDPQQDIDLLRDRIELDRNEEAFELCRMLAHVDDPGAGDTLRRLATHESQAVRAAAMAALQHRLGEPATTTSLRHGLGDQRPAVVTAALQSVATQPQPFRNELRALAAMPNEDSTPTWVDVANGALHVLASTCEPEDLDLAIRACADLKLERGGGALLDALMRRAPIASLEPALAAHPELREHALAGLATPDGIERLTEFAASGNAEVAASAAEALRRYERRAERRYVPADLRAPLCPAHQHDGDESYSYHFADDEDLDARLSALLNDACHVFHQHADGSWREVYKEKYASALCSEIEANPWLIRRLFALKDRVVTSLTYRAMQLRDS